VYLVIVFLSVILPMLLLSSKLKRNLIVAQNLTLTSVTDAVEIVKHNDQTHDKQNT
jgi:hypothetical protein